MLILLKKFYIKPKSTINKLIKKSENNNYSFDYQIADKIFSFYSLFWILNVIKKYSERSLLPQDLFMPKVWFQKIFINEFPSTFYFYSIALLGIVSIAMKLFYPHKLIFRILLFIAVFWLNAFVWSYGSFSHSGHLFVLAHLFSVFLISYSKNETNEFSYQIRFFHFGLLVTYTFAGVWKYFELFKELWKTRSLEYTWLGEDGVKTNAIIHMLSKETLLEGWMLNMYNVPFVWQILTFFTFTIQLLSIFGALNRKISYYIVTVLILFHVYNVIFIKTYFYPAIMTLLIFFFPYHLLLKEKYNQFKIK